MHDYFGDGQLLKLAYMQEKKTFAARPSCLLPRSYSDMSLPSCAPTHLPAVYSYSGAVICSRGLPQPSKGLVGPAIDCRPAQPHMSLTLGLAMSNLLDNTGATHEFRRLIGREFPLGVRKRFGLSICEK